MTGKIGFFQLDNLIQNRVPFILLNLGPSLVPLYTSIYKMHVQNHEILTDEVQTLKALEEMKAPRDAALVVICENGEKSSRLLMDLEKKGYSNVYLMDGGYQQLMTERSQA
jgi:rhodanese-related sulfurtransferase